MSVSATNTYSVALTGDVQGALTIPGFNNATSPGQRQTVALAAGANTITPPTGTRLVVLVPPTNSVNSKTLKGITGDTGVPLDPAGTTILPFSASPGTFVITSGGTETVTFYWL